MKNIVSIILIILCVSCAVPHTDTEKENIYSTTELSSENVAKEQTAINSKSEINSDYNKTDSNGKKQGLWIEEDGQTRIERCYKDGIRSGVYKQFFYGNLSILGEYTNDKESGIWYYYDLGRLIMTFENFAKNYDTITNEGDKKKYVPDYKCYMKGYHSNGNINEEGWLLWNEGEGFETDFSIEYGTWKYYNEKGKLIRTKEFNP